MTDDESGACRWCEGEGRLVLLSHEGLPEAWEPCPHCSGTGAGALPEGGGPMGLAMAKFLAGGR